MKRVTAVQPPKLENQSAQYLAWLLGFVYLSLLLLVLVKFDEFVPFVEAISGGELGKVIAASVVILQVFSLPFLLRMNLSPLMRIFSLICGWLVAFLWLWIAKSALPILILPSVATLGLVLAVSYFLRGDISPAKTVKPKK